MSTARSYRFDVERESERRAERVEGRHMHDLVWWIACDDIGSTSASGPCVYKLRPVTWLVCWRCVGVQINYVGGWVRRKGSRERDGEGRAEDVEEMKIYDVSGMLPWLHRLRYNLTLHSEPLFLCL
jgi:hypothetical protein